MKVKHTVERPVMIAQLFKSQQQRKQKYIAKQREFEVLESSYLSLLSFAIKPRF